MTKHAMIFKPELGTAFQTEARLDEEGDIAIDWLYETIGCSMVQLVPLDSGDLWIDEEGKFNGAELNKAATLLAFGEIATHDCIVGTAVFFPRE